MVTGAVVLIVGAGYTSYKLSQQDVQKIEQHTGKQADEFSEEEMEAAMDQLEIQDRELTAEDEAAIEAEAFDYSSRSKSCIAAWRQQCHYHRSERWRDAAPCRGGDRQPRDRRPGGTQPTGQLVVAPIGPMRAQDEAWSIAARLETL